MSQFEKSSMIRSKPKDWYSLRSEISSATKLLIWNPGSPIHVHLCCTRGRAEARWCPGQEERLATHMFEPKVFRSKCTVLKKVLATLLKFSASSEMRLQGSCALEACATWLCSHNFSVDLNSETSMALICWWYHRARRFGQRELSLPYAWKSLLSVACLVFPFLLAFAILACM